MIDLIDRMYASGATEEEIEEFIKNQSGTSPEYEDQKSSAETELERELYERI